MTVDLTWAGFLSGLCTGLLVSFVFFVWFGVRLAKRTAETQNAVRDAALRNLTKNN